MRSCRASLSSSSCACSSAKDLAIPGTEGVEDGDMRAARSLQKNGRTSFIASLAFAWPIGSCWNCQSEVVFVICGEREEYVAHLKWSVQLLRSLPVSSNPLRSFFMEEVTEPFGE